MAIISLASTTGSGFLEADFNQMKQLLQDGGTTPGTTSPLATKTGTETFTNKTIQGATLSSTTVNSGTISGGTVDGSTATSINFSNPARFLYYDAGNSGTGKTIDWNNGAYQKVTMTGNCTFSFTAPVTGSGRAVRLQLNTYQDSTGSRVATWPSSVKWQGITAPTLTTTGSRYDVIAIVYNSATYAAQSSLNFSD